MKTKRAVALFLLVLASCEGVSQAPPHGSTNKEWCAYFVSEVCAVVGKCGTDIAKRLLPVTEEQCLSDYLPKGKICKQVSDADRANEEKCVGEITGLHEQGGCDALATVVANAVKHDGDGLPMSCINLKSAFKK